MIAVSLQYFDDCPNWQIARDRLLDAIDHLGRELFEVDLRLITGYEQAVAEGFRGSPSFLVDGRDPFADHHVPVGLTCRSYPTEAGPAGAPTLEQLLQVLERALGAGEATDGRPHNTSHCVDLGPPTPRLGTETWNGSASWPR